MKNSYLDSANKRIVQRILFRSIRGRFTNLIGLGGPSLGDYLRIISSSGGIKNATIYENNSMQLMYQIANMSDIMPTRVFYDDIYNARNDLKDTLYDLDFCCSIHKAEKHIEKFKHNPFILTLSIRPVGLKDSIDGYVSFFQKSKNYHFNLIDDNRSYREYELFLDNFKHTVFIYRDSVPMLVFHNL